MISQGIGPGMEYGQYADFGADNLDPLSETYTLKRVCCSQLSQSSMLNFQL